MSTYYVGPGGDNGNNGTSWANRKLTLNGAEDIPVSAGDTVYVGPGVYRETLTVDASGSSGNLITYIGDVTGEHTDGIGGIVRITGSDNDTTETRNNCITMSSKNYRSFQSLSVGETADSPIYANACTYISIIGIVSVGLKSNNVEVIGASTNWTVENCFLLGGTSRTDVLEFSHTSDVTGNHSIKNCIIVGGTTGVYLSNIGNVTIKNCTFCNNYTGINSVNNPASTGTIVVYNSIFFGNYLAIRSRDPDYIVENYNNIYGNVAREDVAIGAQSNAYPPIFDTDILYKGASYPWNPFALSKWSQLARIAGTGEATDDIYGITRPTTSTKKSWGAIQYIPTSRTTGVKYAGSASLKLPDAGAHQMFVPSANQTTSVSIQCYIEGSYNGTQPQIIIKQPGQSDRTNTRTGSTSAWVEITDSFTPAATPPYFVVEMRSNNNTSVGSYATYFDDFTVS